MRRERRGSAAVSGAAAARRARRASTHGRAGGAARYWCCVGAAHLLARDEVAEGEEMLPEPLAAGSLLQEQVADQQHGLAGHLASNLGMAGRGWRGGATRPSEAERLRLP